MHSLHDYIARQIADKLKRRKVVVVYDPRRDFSGFFDELRGEPTHSGAAADVLVAGTNTKLAEYDDSYFELRAVVEPFVAGDEPETVLLYMPGLERDRRGSVLMELEKGGECYEPQLKQLARHLLRQRYTDGVIDEILSPEHVTYQDLVRAASDSTSAEPPSLLKGIFHEVSGNDEILAVWVVRDAHDQEIVTKEAVPELLKLIRSRLGLDLPGDASLGKLRSITQRYILATEYRADLLCAPPSSLDGIPRAKKDDEATVKQLAARLRAKYAGEYEMLADGVEADLRLENANIPAEALGSIDTFRFEERALLRHCGQLIAAHRYDEALAIATQRDHSFWLDRSVARKAQWEACRRMAELGQAAAATSAALKKAGSDPNAWVASYTEQGGWYRLDQAQRRLESWVANLQDEADEQPLGVVRRAYEDACHAMTEGFVKTLAAAHWPTLSALHQTQVFSSVLSERPKPVAYLLIDAMRFEMGVELAERLPKSAEVGVRPAIAALPSITPIGMAALLPGAASSFSVVEQNQKLGALIEGSFLPDLVARKKLFAARVPQLLDLTLDEVLNLAPSKLAKKIDASQVVVVRSQEIDHAGEAGFNFQARQVMDTVIDNIARAVRKLAAAGVEYSVITADHGHMFFAEERSEAMRMDSPGGDCVDLHRRCWIGRGGSTPPGCIRVPASVLGYASDLDFVFPVGCAVFKAGGDLAFHHGGPSLQELIIPVVSVRLKGQAPLRSSANLLVVSGTPEVITNRIFSITLQLGGNLALFSREMVLRPFLISSEKQVGAAGMAVDADFDRATGCVKLQAGKPATVAFLLSAEAVTSLRIVVQDPESDAEIYRSPADIPVRLGV